MESTRCICEGCGKELEVGNWNRYCKDTAKRCRQRAHRKTEEGKAYVKNYNKRYKREDLNLKCDVCGCTFVSARKNRYVCDKEECRKAAAVIAKKRMFVKNPNLHKAYRDADNIRKKIYRGTINRSPCTVCGAVENVQIHHPDYEKPYDYIWLCQAHHTGLHKSLSGKDL